MFFNQSMDSGNADAVFIPRTKECLVVRQHDLVPFLQIPVDGFPAGSSHVDDPFLVALADDADAVVIDICEIQSDQLRAADAAVQKQHQDRKIPVFVRPIDRFQKCGRFFQCQVFRQTASDFGEFNILDRVILDLLGADRQVFIQCLDSRELPRTGSSGDSNISRAFTVLPIVCEIRQKIKHLRGCYRIKNRCVDPFDVDLIKRRIVRKLFAHQCQKSKKHAQIQMIFRDCTLGLPLDGFVIR